MKPKGTMQLNKTLRLFSVKVILLGVTVLLLLSSVIFLTMAWYTKMVSVSGMEFHAAQWDFTANYAVDHIEINVFEYATLEKGRAAPGTGGMIPLRLSAWQSDTDVEYAITIDRSQMSEEFRERIYFYYLVDEVVVENGETVTKQKKVYFNGSPTDPEAKDEILRGEIKKNGEMNMYIYWEWLYTAPASLTEGLEPAARLEVEAAWDEFDTAVGKNPELYVQDMNAKISIVGVEVEPKQNS